MGPSDCISQSERIDVVSAFFCTLVIPFPWMIWPVWNYDERTAIDLDWWLVDSKGVLREA